MSSEQKVIIQYTCDIAPIYSQECGSHELYTENTDNIISLREKLKQYAIEINNDSEEDITEWEFRTTISRIILNKQYPTEYLQGYIIYSKILSYNELMNEPIDINYIDLPNMETIHVDSSDLPQLDYVRTNFHKCIDKHITKFSISGK